MFRSSYLFAFFVFILLSVSRCFKVLSLLTNITFNQFKSLYHIFNCATFMVKKDGLTIRNIWKRPVAFVLAFFLLFFYYVLHKFTQRRSEKKTLSFDDKFS